MANTNISQIVVRDLYMEFPGDTDPEQAKNVFERRFKYPAEVAEVKGWRLLVGPVKAVTDD